MCRQCGDDVAILQSLMSSPYESDVKGRKRGEREERESNVSWKEQGNGEWNQKPVQREDLRGTANNKFDSDVTIQAVRHRFYVTSSLFYS